MSRLTDVYESTLEWAEQRTLDVNHAAQMDSTNDSAKDEALSVESDFKLYLTSHQTKGRGRGTHSWQDTGSGDCLLSSWSFQLNKAPQPITGPCLGLALYHAAQKVWPQLSWSIKPPNDLYLDGKKIAGILTEVISSGPQLRLIVGLGFNVLNHPRAIENSTHLGADVEATDWFVFLDELLARLRQASFDSQNSILSPSQQHDLLNAINANPTKSEMATEVTSHGDIVYPQRRTRWTDL
jgi:BirA family biotin operon repressor/biotin-[acetyl-CoA-carboxylase] ligase